MKKTLTLVLLFFSIHTFADWPIGKKRALINLSYNYYTVNKYYNGAGLKTNFTQGDVFTAQSIGLGWIYGLGRYVNLIVNVPLVYQSAIIEGSQLAKAGAGDAQMGLSFHLPSKTLKSFFTLKALAITPLYNNYQKPYLGYGSNGLLLGTGYSFGLAPKTFCALEATYTRYFADDGTGPDQIGYNATVGTQTGNYVYWIASFGGMISKSTNKAFSSNLGFNKDFDYGKTTLAIGKRITRTTTMYLQGFYFPFGHNAGEGKGGSLSIAVKIP